MRSLRKGSDEDFGSGFGELVYGPDTYRDPDKGQILTTIIIQNGDQW